MLKSYELLYIVHPDLEGTTDKVMDKVAGFIKKTDGEVLSQEDWGKRKLAYKVTKNDFGVYVLVQFQTESTKLREIERNLHLSEEIMRSMIVSLPEVKEIRQKTKSKVEKTENLLEPIEEEIKMETEKEIKKPASKKTVQKEVAAKEKPKKTTRKTETQAKTQIKETGKKATDEKERMKKLDEKLEELLK